MPFFGAPPFIPNIIHPVKIQMVRIDPVKSPGIDPIFQEPTGKPVYSDPFTLLVQIAFGQTKGYHQRPGGDRPESDGHVAVTKFEWDTVSPIYPPHKGDLIQKINVGQSTEETVNWHIIRVEPKGHYVGGQFYFWHLFYKRIFAADEAAG